jgi:hypothetical protein
VKGSETSFSVKLSPRSRTKTALAGMLTGSSEETVAANPIKMKTPRIEKTNKASNAARNDLKKLFIKQIDCKRNRK